MNIINYYKVEGGIISLTNQLNVTIENSKFIKSKNDKSNGGVM